MPTSSCCTQSRGRRRRGAAARGTCRGTPPLEFVTKPVPRSTTSTFLHSLHSNDSTRLHFVPASPRSPSSHPEPPRAVVRTLQPPSFCPCHLVTPHFDFEGEQCACCGRAMTLAIPRARGHALPLVRGHAFDHTPVKPHHRVPARASKTN